MANFQTLQQIAKLEESLDDQAALIRKLAKGYRMVWNELDKDVPDVDRALDLLDEHYVGGRGKIQKSLPKKWKGQT